MNYRNIRFRVNRPLTDDELATKFDVRRRPDAVPYDFLSVIKMDSVRMELVDRWYATKGFNTWLGAFLCGSSALLIGILLFFTFVDPVLVGIGSQIGVVVFSIVGLLLMAAGGTLIGFECFRKTHYPIILDRDERMVHVMRMDGTVLSVSWEKLFFCVGHSKAFLTGDTHDLRAHVLAEDGRTVLETFSLVYAFLAPPKRVEEAWAFVWNYMEAPDGARTTFELLEESAMMPIDGRKEGGEWSIVRTFLPGARMPLYNLILCVPLALNALGRMVAMGTSSLPVWPSSVRDSARSSLADPYLRTATSNLPLGFFERGWSIICFFIGLAISIVVMVMLPRFA